jgi:hypothetical protein
MDAMTPATGRSKIRSLGIAAVIALVVLLVVIDMRRRSAENQLAALSMKMEQLTGGQTQNQEAAKEIVDKVRKIYELPVGIEPTVATIVDVDALRERNSFYNKAENGDYLIVTTDRALLVNSEGNMIIDVVPVQITPEGEGQGQSSVRR